MQNGKRLIWFIVVTGLLCSGNMLLVADVGSAAVAPAELAKNLIVKITAENIAGAGIIFGRSGDSLFIATANHVVRYAGKDAQNLLVEFNFWPEPVEAKLSQKYDPTLDLAVLIVNTEKSDLTDDLLNQSLPLEQLGYVNNVEVLKNLYPVGHPPAMDWLTPPNPVPLTEVEGETIRFYFQCDQGYSGGGLFDEQWRLVGMVQRFNTPLCEALSFERMCATLKKWRFAVNLNPIESKVVMIPEPLPEVTATPMMVALLTPTPQPTVTPTLRPMTPTPTIQTQKEGVSPAVRYGTPIYSKPNGEGTILTRVDTATALTVLVQNGEWYQVKTSGGITGWVSKDSVPTATSTPVPTVTSTPRPNTTPTPTIQTQKEGVSPAVRYGTPIYSKPNGEGTILTRVDTATALTVLVQNGEWYQVKTSGGITGWVSKDNIIKSP